MHVLHTSRGSGGFAVHALLEEAGAKYRLVEVDTKAGEHRSPAFLKLNPMGQVPVLELPSGKVMTESAAMVIYLADRLKPGSLAPTPASPARPAYLRWLLFMAVNLYGSDLHVYYPERYTSDPAGAAAVKQAGIEALDRQLAILDDAIGSNRFLLGSRYSAADPYLLMLVHWHPEPDSVFGRCANIARVCEAVRNRKAIRSINAFHRLW